MTKKKKSGRQETLPIKDYDTKIKYIMDHFNFTKVHDAMLALDWKWQHSNDLDDQTTRVPTIERMKTIAHYLLYKAATEKERHWGTGGFEVRRFMSGELSLMFVVAEYHSCND